MPRRLPELCALALLLCTAAIATVPTSAGAKTRPNCGVKGAWTEARTSQTRVVMTEIDTGDLYGPDTDVYLCHGPRGDAQHVAWFSGESATVSDWEIAGRTVGFVSSTYDTACSKYDPGNSDCGSTPLVRAYDAKTGKGIVEEPLGGTLLKLTVSRWGGAAWVTDSPAGPTLRATRKGRPPVQFAVDPSLVVKSVALTPSTVRWTGGGRVHVAQLP